MSERQKRREIRGDERKGKEGFCKGFRPKELVGSVSFCLIISVYVCVCLCVWQMGFCSKCVYIRQGL